MEIKRIMSKTSIPTAEVEGYLLHSKYDPLKEAQTIANRMYKANHLHIIYGYGYGYIAHALRDITQFNEPILVIEPLNKQLVDFTDLPANTYCYGLEAIEEIEIAISAFGKEARAAFSVICSPNYDKLFPKEYKRLLEKVRGVQYNHAVNDNTLRKFSYKWHENMTKNLQYVNRDNLVNILEKKYTCPIIVVSSGPSLQKQIDLLRKYRKCCILVAAGSTINVLLDNNIEPDYVVSIDGGEPNKKHFENIRLKEAKLIYSLLNHPFVRTCFEKPAYIVDQGGFNEFTKYLQAIGVAPKQIEAGGTVAHLAFMFAQFITTGPIALIGQDLAYTDNLTHAKGNLNARLIDEQFIKKNLAFLTESYEGTKVYTNPVFYSMKLEFEKLLVKYPPTTPVYNCTEGGVILEGYTQMTFERFLETYTTNTPIKIIEPVENNRQLDLLTLWNSELKEYRNLKQTLTKGLEILAKNSSNQAYSQKTLKQLDDIDAKLNAALLELPLDIITAPILLDSIKKYLPKLDETVEEKYERSFNQTKELYKNIIEALTFAEICTRETIKELEEEYQK